MELLVNIVLHWDFLKGLWKIVHLLDIWWDAYFVNRIGYVLLLMTRYTHYFFQNFIVWKMQDKMFPKRLEILKNVIFVLFKIHFLLLGMTSRKDYATCVVTNKYKCQNLNWTAPCSFSYIIYFHGSNVDEIIDVLMTLPIGELIK